MTNPPEIATLLAPERFREIVVSSLVDGRILQTTTRGDAQPADLAVELLRTLDGGPVRKFVLAGVRDVWLLIQQAVVEPDCNADAPIRDGSEPLSEIISHFGALLNRAAPPELEALPYSLLEIVLRADVDRVLYGPLVRAALAYAHGEQRVPFWESQAASDLVPGWAFKALAQIDPEHPRLPQLLVLRWTKLLARQTSVDPVIITNEIASKRKDPAAFRRGLWRSIAPLARQMAQYDLFVAKWERVAMQAEEKITLTSDAATATTVHDKISAFLRARALPRVATTHLKHKHIFYGGGHATTQLRNMESSSIYVQYHSRGGQLIVQKAARIEPHIRATGLSASEVHLQFHSVHTEEGVGRRDVAQSASHEALLPIDSAPMHIRGARSVEMGNEPGEHAGKWCQTLQINSDIEDTLFQKITDIVLRRAEDALQQTYLDFTKRADEVTTIKSALDY